MKNNYSFALLVSAIGIYFTSTTLIESIDGDVMWKKIASGISLLFVLIFTGLVLRSMFRNKK